MALDADKKAALKAALGELDDETRREVMGEPPAAPPVDLEAVKQAATEATLKVIADKEAADAKAAEVAAKAKADEEDAAFKAAQAEAAKAGGLKPNAGEDTEPRHLYFGLESSEHKSLADLLHVDPKTLGHKQSLVEDFQRWNDDMLLASRLLHRAGAPRDMRPLPAYQNFWGQKSVQSDIKALYSTGAGVGDEWVPTEFSTSWLEKIVESAKVLPLVRSLPMTTNPETYPIFGGRTGTGYLQGEPATNDPVDFTATDIATAQLSLTAKQFAVRTVFSQEYTEDSVAGALEYTRQDIANTAAWTVDLALVDGDTTATHMDTGYSLAANSPRRAFDGLRHWALNSGVTVDGASVTWSSAQNMVSAKSKMGIYAGDNTTLLCSRSFAAKMGLLRDGANNLIPGVGASADSPPTWGGSRVVISDVILDTYNASGIYDSTTATKTMLVWFNPDEFYVGWRRGWTVETEKDIKAGVWNLVMTCRLAFGSPMTVGTHYIANCVYNLLAAW